MQTQNRRSFLKASLLSGGGMLLGFGWLSELKAGQPAPDFAPDWNQLNGYIQITPDNIIKIMSPNPEGGQGVKTSMPMIVAEELDVDWKNVVVEQAPLDTDKYTRQFIGGSQAIRISWQRLRTAGATGRQMLREAAVAKWKVPLDEVTTKAGMLHHVKTGRSAKYGELASAAAQIPVPKEVKLKDVKDFTIIGHSQKSVDIAKILKGEPLFGIDQQKPGMLIAMITHAPAFGLKIKSVDDSAARAMPGIKDVFTVKSMNDDYQRQQFDTCSFTETVAIVGRSTWEVMQAKKALKIEWMPEENAGLESSTDHLAKMQTTNALPAKTRRKDGDPESAFSTAAKIIERTYTGPFLAHNCMEPMNFFADVTDERAELSGPLQKPENTEKTLSARLGMPLDKINITMTRLGGGFGRRSYAHWLLEAAIISQKVKAPVKLMYSREDDMTSGIYRSTYMVHYRAALDANNNLIAFYVKAGGAPESPLSADRFPAGAVDNYLAEEWTVKSNITIGSFRAPRSNFMAAAEQSFLDEVAETAGKDPIDFRLELLKRAKEKPVGKNNDYDADRYAGVLELVRKKSDWDKLKKTRHLGVSAYFSHNSYAAHVLDLELQNDIPVVKKVTCALDCGIVINPDAAINMTEGAVVDGIGTALYGNMTFTKGVPDMSNFHSYRMIRINEAPEKIDVHFVQNTIDPTGMGEPAYPPVFAALANALYKASGKRFYSQPFGPEIAASAPVL